MQILRDTAALAIIILLALTVRIEADGAPIDIDLATPVEAASLETPEPEHAGSENVDYVETDLQFDSLSELAVATVDLARLAELGRHSSGWTAEQSRRTIVIRHQLEALPQRVWEAQPSALDGTWELKLIPDTMTAPEVPKASATCPCEASLNPGLSC